MNAGPTIAAMPLYTHLERIERGLAALGIRPADPIQPEQLFPLDQWHYHGIDAIRLAAERLRLGPASHVLDIGSGIGGPARFLAHTTGCHVTALELQPALHSIAVDLTRRCGLSDRISHICGNALTCPLPDSAFDAAVSWLAILHVPDRPRLLSRIAKALRPGGAIFIEDLCMRAPFNASDQRDLREVVSGIVVTSIADYARELAGAGLADVVATDLTSDWAPYAAERLAAWRSNHDEYARIHGEGAYSAQERFYAVIAHLYDSGSLGGVRLMARHP
jgi:cyclopropane fatty-acyl-phospholipid synthase-like methyltransferase